ncbi:uncharacterized protein LOC111287818 [Durio zibethinus]|uniref:Uncharacterized protein LOC111287818 n=1 Tax=Durio zibethinus TaxID=66656 RepID=A0A6P5Y188_DURZI|nr:uncharacterized protein LOC111287818 [Durio zibethinus]
MEDSGAEFAGFQVCFHKDELVFRRSLSRLQRRAPRPLQVRPNDSLERRAALQEMECSLNSLQSSSSSSSPAAAAAAAAASSSSFNSLIYQSKDPIPLLSPLVLPSSLESSYLHQEGNTEK